MKQGVYFLSILWAAMMSLSCNSSRSTAQSATDAAHNSSNSLDWDGIYRGILPCENCAGIRKTIYLNGDMTYKVQIEYPDGSSPALTQSGSFKWNKEGNTIGLNEGTQTRYYFVGENTLTMLDDKGKKGGDSFMLSKQKYAILEKYWKLIELEGKPVIVDSSMNREPFITFKGDNTYHGNGSCNNFAGSFALTKVNDISIKQGRGTLMACGTNMNLESTYQKILLTAVRFDISADQLTLFDGKSNPIARFKTVYMH